MQFDGYEVRFCRYQYQNTGKGIYHSKTLDMVNTTISQMGTASKESNLTLTFSRYYFRNSKPLLITMGLALVYCAFYGVVLVHEFKKMGILDMIWASK